MPPLLREPVPDLESAREASPPAFPELVLQVWKPEPEGRDAAVMLQRQQASAIIDARKMIVDGAVGMVEMALERLNENNVVELDEERKAAMVSNLLVVLCGNHDAQPVVNSGSLY